MAETIPTLTYGTVTGRFLAAVADSVDDVDTHPDGVPLSGTVVFTPSAKAILIPGVGTVLPAAIEATLDAEGYISLNGERGVELVATDSPIVNPVGFTYAVSFKNLRYGTNNSIAYAGFSIPVTAGSVTDLSVVAPVPSSGGVAIVRGESGDSAYQVAVANGFQGTPTEWLASLVGPPGDAEDVVTSVAGRIGAVVLTKSDVGLSNVANTADADKPVSTAQQGALDAKAPLTHTHTAAQITDASTTWALVGRAVAAGTGLTGGGTLVADRTIALNAASIASLAKADTAVQPAGLTKAAVGLGNVDNTADTAKPVSTAQQTALNAKVTNGGSVATIVQITQTAYNALATKDANTLYVVVG